VQAGSGPAFGASGLGASLGASAEMMPSPVQALTAAATETQKAKATAKQQRALVELLGSPDLETLARKLFGEAGKGKKQLDQAGMAKVLVKVHETCGLEMPEQSQAERLFKKYDVDNSQSLQFPEFFDLLTALLRENAFSRREVINREFFVTKNNENVWDEWKKVKELGAGTFGTAYLARNKGGEERVIKAVKKGRVKMPLEDVEREIMVMRQVDHPHIVRLFQWYEDKKMIYLSLEALKGGTLKEAVLEFSKDRKGVKEDWIREVMKQMMGALAYCHSLRLIHKDIKDENIMLLKSESKSAKPFAVLIDLGIAEMFNLSDPQGKEVGGTPITMAPEVWLNSFGPKCDVWSLGVVLFELLTGGFPFMATSMNPQAWIRLHRRGPDWSLLKTTPASKKMNQVMLTFDEVSRPTMAGCLDHEWFSTEKHAMKTVTPAQYGDLQSFCKESDFKRTLLLDIASRLPMDKARDIVALFETVDANNDGRLDRGELVDFFRKVGVEDKSVIDNVFRALDVDGNEELSFTEFAAGVLYVFQDLLEDRMDVHLARFDKDDDGNIDSAEFNRMTDGVTKAMGGGRSAEDYVGRDIGSAGAQVSRKDMKETLLRRNPNSSGNLGGISQRSSGRSSRR